MTDRRCKVLVSFSPPIIRFFCKFLSQRFLSEELKKYGCRRIGVREN
ncbi:hypothetical protein LEP1GSC103_3077 [Leptospira borgpetersenii serovar Javanica str. UI 09931]|uniref:Uncharacterized protein n=2 Tax=Leptospira borgpetersenii TaxID=174 RepID=A0AAV3JAU2_LEPBO|nr:hypothetical protein LEP1GSC101_3415 [Leptospira borgpetersenii str. UI 09149]EKR01737.1 hypothetical protein LEP1GSC121_3937 [Leptospira borgpetersenii serovar Castellonis str. 200801910]EMK10286.1 hypothetical protein LEP1GSC066_3396 [Leptospira sp. serovar Kenya str. Sh9]EMN14356.1 hypothetical protein LEP1GSC055_2534 [Leptospira borgpetersenii str. Brem 307]EMN19239.1 hypothetical protein LEP1GSC056_2140 [Leptospira borgpetersenii str. Brem 328]EMN56830.1 hypothetical protein LEP1GSC090